MSIPRPVVLCILDGWGLSESPAGNAPALANTPAFDGLVNRCPHATLVTHGPDVGLPRGQMGNSEVGHTNIGAGRVVSMDLGRIDLAIEDKEFDQVPALTDFIAAMQGSGGAAHLIGVVSDGGVHGHVRHLLAAARVLSETGVPVRIHAVTDGRDVAPTSAPGFLEALCDALPKGVEVATVIGRYWAMDRDRRWDRVARAAGTILHGEGERAPDPVSAATSAHARGETDEFIVPTVIGDYAGARDGDGLFCLNFRADRARQILSALADPEFSWPDMPDTAPPAAPPQWAAALGMVDYSEDHDRFLTTVFPKQRLDNTLGAWVAGKGLRQFRLAETEKYPHVTFFLNGGKEVPETGEDRYMAPSPKVATYDLAPEMAAGEVTEQLVAAIASGQYDLIVVNYANPDMVGHTGDLMAAIRACESVDAGLAATLAALEPAGGAMLVIADHGNCEVMVDPETKGPHTAHTLNPVPVVLVGGPAGARLDDGRLGDIAPTILDLMGIPCPAEMTGRSLIRR